MKIADAMSTASVLTGLHAARVLVTCVLLGLSGAPSALAQEIVGTAIVDGAQVSLFSDGTWAFAETPDGECRTIAPSVAFCGAPSVWTVLSTTPPGIAAQYRHSPVQYAQMIIEGLGRAQGLNEKLVGRAALTNAASGMKVRVQDVPVLSDEAVTLDGVAGRTLVYAVNLSGTHLVFANSYFIRENQTLQLQTYVVGAREYDEAHKVFHAAFLDQMDLRE